MTMLKKLPEEVLNLWNNWEIRGMVLLSLLLQTILIVFGSRRKTDARSWIRILVWSAYLSADMVATVALGNLARSQGDSSGDSSEKANNSIQAFWAPFLLLHLGGPDTITAYSIEDNELWLRHLLGLVFQVGVAFYVFSRSWGSGILSFIAIPMFVVGIAKYAERTWVLWSSCSKSLKKSYFSDFRDSYDRTRISKTRPQDHQRDYLLQAYDLVVGIPALIRSRDLISKNTADGAFKVVEAELGLIYDMLYTKAPLIYSRGGIILRCISSLLSVTAFITFQVKIDKHDYSTTTDLAITYLLFATAVFLEFYAFSCLVLSDWTVIWLIDEGENALTGAIYSLIRKLTRSERWSRSISQYNLISSSFESEPHRCLELLGIDEMKRQMHVDRKDLNGELQGLIFEHLREKAQKIKEDLNVCDKNHRSKIIGKRGDGVLEREGLLRDYKWCTTEVEFSRSILVWHLATEFCYCDDMKEADAYLNKDGSSVSTEYETSKCLSEYMMYLLVIRPNMLSKGFVDDEEYLTTLRELRGLKDGEFQGRKYRRTLRELQGLKDRGPDDEGYQHALRELRNSLKDRYPDERSWKIEKSVLRGVERLASQLLRLGPEKRREIINAYLCSSSMSMERAYSTTEKRWRYNYNESDELFLDVTEYEYNSFKDYNSLNDYVRGHDLELPWVKSTKNISREEEEYRGAIDRYLRGNADMSPSSSNEEVKELKRMVAYKDEELERKERELEQLRSFLGASTP
ncbi:hypothetical protein NC653_035294 [Populus alba x Populus x berolinensis]|uniref:DUF4220 domain-containing protein n=1 Tax=Populus alba x Populus x berolinensis TaxID=444605 RepID=A0AAD6LPL1_9ROSI|nr:hypothetical protein NC653_035294 [Populus alba x Populus x berolinensis]